MYAFKLLNIIAILFLFFFLSAAIYFKSKDFLLMFSRFNFLFLFSAEYLLYIPSTAQIVREMGEKSLGSLEIYRFLSANVTFNSLHCSKPVLFLSWQRIKCISNQSIVPNRPTSGWCLVCKIRTENRKIVRTD